MWRKRRGNARTLLPPCCVEYQQRTGTRQMCPQHEQRTAANNDHLQRLQRAEVFDKLHEAFGADARGPERTWSYDTGATTNPDDGSTTDNGDPSRLSDATTRWLSERSKKK